MLVPANAADSIERRIRDLEQLGSRSDRIAGNVRVVQKNRSAENDHRVVFRELIRERLLRRQQTAFELRMRARKGPARRNRFLIHVGVEMFGQRDDVVPRAIFFDLRADDEREIRAAVDRANGSVERSSDQASPSG